MLHKIENMKKLRLCQRKRFIRLQHWRPVERLLIHSMTQEAKQKNKFNTECSQVEVKS